MAVHLVDAITRRASLPVLGVIGMGMVPTPLTEARNKSKKRRKKVEKKARQKCQNQAEECVTVFEDLCGGDEPCLERLLPCCEFVGRCDFTEALSCMLLLDDA